MMADPKFLSEPQIAVKDGVKRDKIVIRRTCAVQRII